MDSDPSVAAASPAVISDGWSPMDSIGVLKSDLRSPALRDDEGTLYYVCPRGADSHSLAMARRQRVFRHECGAADAPLRINDCQFALGFECANLSKNRPDASGRYACSDLAMGRIRSTPRSSLSLAGRWPG
jgi:hypothetical protein